MQNISTWMGIANSPFGLKVKFYVNRYTNWNYWRGLWIFKSRAYVLKIGKDHKKKANDSIFMTIPHIKVFIKQLWWFSLNFLNPRWLTLVWTVVSHLRSEIIRRICYRYIKDIDCLTQTVSRNSSEVNVLDRKESIKRCVCINHFLSYSLLLCQWERKSMHVPYDPVKRLTFLSLIWLSKNQWRPLHRSCSAAGRTGTSLLSDKKYHYLS